MPAPNLVVHATQKQVAAEFWRKNAEGLTVTEFSRRLERRGLVKERSALSRILHCETAAAPHELEVMASELGFRLTWKLARRRAA